MPRQLEEKLQAYITETLGLNLKVHAWARENEMPYFLRDAFDWREIELLGQPLLLALDRQEEKPSLADVRSRLNKAKLLFDRQIIYVTGSLASYQRRYLIEQKVPFVVPGNQLYLPDLGIDLREYFRQRPAAPDTSLSPAAQAVLISVLLHPERDEIILTELADGLRYSSMTLSRAFKELTAAGLVSPQGDDRRRRLRLECPPAEAWERAFPLLRNPVLRVVSTYLEAIRSLREAPVAGLSALSRYTMISEPRSPVHAVSSARWKQAIEEGLPVLPEWQPGAVEWQIWRYEPMLGSDRGIVDPLSLILSLREEADERIQMALGELRERLPW